jgi:hypothetical protein
MILVDISSHVRIGLSRKLQSYAGNEINAVAACKWQIQSCPLYTNFSQNEVIHLSIFVFGALYIVSTW